MIALSWCTWAFTPTPTSPPGTLTTPTNRFLTDRPRGSPMPPSSPNATLAELTFSGDLPHSYPPLPSLKSNSLQLPTGDLVTKVFWICSSLFPLCQSRHLRCQDHPTHGMEWHGTLPLMLAGTRWKLTLPEVSLTELSSESFPSWAGGGAQLSAKYSPLFWTHGRLLCATFLWQEKVSFFLEVRTRSFCQFLCFLRGRGCGNLVWGSLDWRSGSGHPDMWQSKQRNVMSIHSISNQYIYTGHRTVQCGATWRKIECGRWTGGWTAEVH